ncbi:MAG: hypothetical protein ABEJ83_00245 [Candidatus Nanohaloarchaea archaeon]
MEFKFRPVFNKITITRRSKILIGGFLTVLSIFALLQFTASKNHVTEIHHYRMTGNLGDGEAYDLKLSNGKEIHLTTYTNRHPLCQGQQNITTVDCSDYGEKQVEPGFNAAEKVYRTGYGVSYGLSGNRFKPIATCYDRETHSFYRCKPLPTNFLTASVKTITG